MESIVDDATILSWYTGNARGNVAAIALPMLHEAEQQGFWPKGASRRVPALLNKSSIAVRAASRFEREFKERRNYKNAGEEWLWGLSFAMRFGDVGSAKRLLKAAAKMTRSIEPHPWWADEYALFMPVASKWMRDFAELGQLMVYLDNTMPKPFFCPGKLSPTAAKTLASCGVGDLLPETMKICIEWKLREEKLPDGQTMRVWVAVVVWPKGTRHNTSRFSTHRSRTRGSNMQCELCGHAIKNESNWMPLALWSNDKVPHSLWVGLDCASRVFGVKAKNLKSGRINKTKPGK